MTGGVSSNGPSVPRVNSALRKYCSSILTSQFTVDTGSALHRILHLCSRSFCFPEVDIGRFRFQVRPRCCGAWGWKYVCQGNIDLRWLLGRKMELLWKNEKTTETPCAGCPVCAGLHNINSARTASLQHGQKSHDKSLRFDIESHNKNRPGKLVVTWSRI